MRETGERYGKGDSDTVRQVGATSPRPMSNISSSITELDLPHTTCHKLGSFTIR